MQGRIRLAECERKQWVGDTGKWKTEVRFSKLNQLLCVPTIDSWAFPLLFFIMATNFILGMRYLVDFSGWVSSWMNNFWWKHITGEFSYWLKTLEGVTSELYNISVQPSNLDHAAPLKKTRGHFFFCSWINQQRFSENGDSKLRKLRVAPSLD